MRTSATLNFAVYFSLGLGKPASPPWGPWSTAAPTASVLSSAPTAWIDSGIVVGQTVSIAGSELTAVNQFLGIPFAQPPIDDLRFAPPQRPHPWASPKLATRLPPARLQDFGNASSGRAFQMNVFNTPPPPNGESEDCLYLNIYAPTGGPENKPVFFWIYGGGLLFGANSLPLYDGTDFAANQDIIVVTINYRTNCKFGAVQTCVGY